MMEGDPWDKSGRYLREGECSGHHGGREEGESDSGVELGELHCK